MILGYFKLDLDGKQKKSQKTYLAVNPNHIWELIRRAMACPRWVNIPWRACHDSWAAP
ncbi:unnamed protein product [Laminaria digitata]